jgi:hypothetical protein
MSGLCYDENKLQGLMRTVRGDKGKPRNISAAALERLIQLRDDRTTSNDERGRARLARWLVARSAGLVTAQWSRPLFASCVVNAFSWPRQSSCLSNVDSLDRPAGTKQRLALVGPPATT